MKIIRSTKCSLKFATEAKRKEIELILTEYGKVVNFFINAFWDQSIEKKNLLKEIVNLPVTWLCARMRKVAAREAIDLISSAKEVAIEREEEPKIPVHKGNRMMVSSTTAELTISKKSTEFDAWLHLQSIGNNIIINLPIKFHKHFHKWNNLSNSRRLNSYIITKDYVQFCFEIRTEPKITNGDYIGIDSGMNMLATTSSNHSYGEELKKLIEEVNRSKKGSVNRKRKTRKLKQYIDETAKNVISQEQPQVIVVEKLKNISKDTKKKLPKFLRKLLGSWNYRYWLNRIEMQCEENRVSFRTVSPYQTSITCSNCGGIEKSNRNGNTYNCNCCGITLNADYNAAINILNRWLKGAYGPLGSQT
jgi:IS605 OrfB family transposase